VGFVEAALQKEHVVVDVGVRRRLRPIVWIAIKAVR
jgi:hypothetical protein